MRSKNGFLSIVVTIALLASAASIGSEASREVEVRGKVLASFDEDYAILETKSKLFRIKISALSFLQRQKLKHISSETKLKVPVQAIDLSWSIYPSERPRIPQAELDRLPEAIEKLQSHDGIVEIVGRKLPSIPSETAFVQVNDRVYAIHKEKVPPESRSRLDQEVVSAYIPQSSVLFSWKLDSAKPDTKEALERQLVELEGDRIKIVGRSLYSFEEPYVLILADKSVIRLRRASLSKKQESLLEEVGKTVRMKVPGEAVTHLWSVKQEPQALEKLILQ